MEAEETVMDKTTLSKFWLETDNPIHWLPPPFSWDVEKMLKAQAEISFTAGKKAGMKEVVEWIDSNSYRPSVNEDDTGEMLLGIREFEWKAKLKEWGLDEEGG